MKVGYHEPGDVYITYDEYSEGTIVNLRHVHTPSGEPWIGLGPYQTRESLEQIGAIVPEESQGTHYGILSLIPETQSEATETEPEQAVEETKVKTDTEPEPAQSTKKEITIVVDGTVKFSMTVEGKTVEVDVKTV